MVTKPKVTHKKKTEKVKKQRKMKETIATGKKKIVKPNPPSQNQRELNQKEVDLELYNIKKKE